MPRPYRVRGGWRATFTGVVLEYAMRAGFTGEGLAALTEYTAEGENLIGLRAASRPCAAVIDQVLACLAAANLIEPASALAALELTQEVHQRVTRLGPVPPRLAGSSPARQAGGLLGSSPASPSRPTAADLVPSCRSVRLYRLAAFRAEEWLALGPGPHVGVDDERESHLGDVPGGLDCSVRGALPAGDRSGRGAIVSLLSDNGIPIDEIARLVGHSSTAVTELVYRQQIRPVLQSGAVVMDRIFNEESDA
jgi:hypothetical protein